MKEKSYSIYLLTGILLIILAVLLFSCKKLDIKRVAKVQTGLVTNITSNSCTIQGTIIDNGGVSITQHGHCWSVSENPSVSDSTTHLGSRNSTGSFTSNLTGLSSNTIYYVKAYSTNNKDTAYGNVTNLKTSLGLPSLNTTTVTSITDITSKTGGKITNDGGTPVTFRGVCWNTSQNPTIADNKTTDGTGSGSFISNLTGLTAITKYYIRAYATNSAGTAYGNQVSFVTLKTGQFTDIEGNIYNSVTIGTQVWMKENLKTITFNDNYPIPNVTNNATWWGLSTPAYRWYNDNTAAYKDTYGALYNWYAVNTYKLCPVGWHVPSNAEWSTLETYLGGSNVAGGKLKETGTLHWNSPNSGATNESGFTALGSGQSGYSGGFANMGIEGLWWSATVVDATDALFCYMRYDNTDVARFSLEKARGCSVRCVRDTNK